MAKSKEANIIIDANGTAHDPNPEIKPFALSDLGITTDTLKKDVVPKVMSLIVDASIDGVRKELGLSKKSALKENTKAFKVSTFFKEVAWSLIMMGAAVMALSIFFRLVIRWVGL